MFVRGRCNDAIIPKCFGVTMRCYALQSQVRVRRQVIACEYSYGGPHLLDCGTGNALCRPT